MPCRCEDYSGDDSHYEKEANAATRAACDLRTILRRGGKEEDLTQETRKWIAKHDKWDAKRIAEENARGEREKVKKRALNKLTLDERRVLGL